MSELPSRPAMRRTARRRGAGQRALGALGRGAVSAARGLDLARRIVLDLAFLLLLIFVAVWLLRDRAPAVPERAALALRPSGVLVEQLYGEPESLALGNLLGGRPAETLVRDLVDAVRAARDDERVRALVLELDGMTGAGLSPLEDLAAAIGEFRASGKPVVAVADLYLQSQYYLAAGADEIVTHPMGLVFLSGFGSYRNFYREALDRLAIEWNVFRVGEYKSAVEPYLRQEMSPEDRAARLQWLDALWREFGEAVDERRGLAPRAVADYAAGYDERLADHDGDGAALALAAGLVDRLAYPDEVRERLVELVGAEDPESDPRIGHDVYLRAVERPRREGSAEVAVIVAKGEIVSGTQPPGVIGAESLSKLIAAARDDEEVEAVVLRIDSPGGNALAAERIRRELELVRRAGKPVVASMGSVAASGGYWIALASDQIWASPTTLTGSIGIYASIPTFAGTLAKIGVANDGVGTGPLAGTLRPERSLPPEARHTLQLLIEQGYRDFVERVAESRSLAPEEVDRLGRGRVWTGAEAAAAGLVDRLGSLEEATAAAAELAGLGDDWRPTILEPRPSLRWRLMEWLLTRLGASGAARPPALVAGAVRELAALRSDLGGALGPGLGAPLSPTAGLLRAHCHCEMASDLP